MLFLLSLNSVPQFLAKKVVKVDYTYLLQRFDKLKGTVRSLLNQNKMLAEREANLEGHFSKNRKEEVQIPNYIRVIS